MKSTSVRRLESPAKRLSVAKLCVALVVSYSSGTSSLNFGQVEHQKAENEAHDQTQNAYHDGDRAQPPFASRVPQDAEQDTQGAEEDREDEEGYRPGDYPGDRQVPATPAGRMTLGRSEKVVAARSWCSFRQRYLSPHSTKAQSRALCRLHPQESDLWAASSTEGRLRSSPCMPGMRP